jgi:DNA invertase Pin-like site-specific DNA recombinase
MSEWKITASHLRRPAVIYVRQSTLAQVERNRESTARQYDLASRARELGWPASAVTVIDEDLGISGRPAADRSGFADLATRVGLGQVGIVLSLECSRLARNNSDWYRLLDLAGMTGTLIADADGVYHPAMFNDRLLLGMKGTMAEALSGIRHKLSYADFSVMPTRRREHPAGRDDGRNVRHNHSASRNASMSSAGW